MKQARRLERLFDEVERAAPDRRDRGIEAAMARNDDDRQRWIERLDRFDETEAVEPRALQPDVDQCERRPPLTDCFERGIAVGRGARLITFVFHDPGD